MNSAIAFVALAFVAVVSAGKTNYGPLAGPAPLALGAPVYGAPAQLISTGSSNQFRSEDSYGNYNFGYDESHATGATSRREEQVNGIRRGSYSLNDADGRHRVVTYVADADGFRATVETNEPGVEPKDSADVLVNKGAAIAAHAAPLPVAAPLALPAPAPLALPAPAPLAVGPVKGYGRIAAPQLAIAPVAVEAPTPRAFSYSFGASHLAPSAPLAAPLPIHAAAAPLPIHAAAPIYQQQQQLDY